MTTTTQEAARVGELRNAAADALKAGDTTTAYTYARVAAMVTGGLPVRRP